MPFKYAHYRNSQLAFLLVVQLISSSFPQSYSGEVLGGWSTEAISNVRKKGKLLVCALAPPVQRKQLGTSSVN